MRKENGTIVFFLFLNIQDLKYLSDTVLVDEIINN